MNVGEVKNSAEREHPKYDILSENGANPKPRISVDLIFHRPAQNKLFINSGKVLCQLAQLFPNRLADLLCRFTAATELQEIPVCLCSIGAGLAAVGRIMQFVQ